MVRYSFIALSAIVIVFALSTVSTVAQDIENRRPAPPVFIDSRDDGEAVDGILEIAGNQVIRQEDKDVESPMRKIHPAVESVKRVSRAGVMVVKSSALGKNSGNRKRRGAGKRRLSRAKSYGIVADNSAGYRMHTISESRARKVNQAGSL